MATTWTGQFLRVIRTDFLTSLVSLTRLTKCLYPRNCLLEQNSLDISSCRLLSYTASCRKGPEPVTTTVSEAKKTNQPVKSNQMQQRRVERIRPSSSRTPWMESGKKLLIWEGYKRNHKGAVPPVKTRARCKRGKDKISGNPCPVCRNNVNVHFRNTKLLEQFICSHTGQILEASKTGLCRQQQKRMVAAIEKAWDYGLITFSLPRQLPEESIRIPPWNRLNVE